MKSLLLTGLIMIFALPAAAAPPAAELDGAALLEQRCSVCHPSARPKSKQKTPTEWEATVTRMMGKGASLTPEEKQALVDYLAQTYKP